MDFNFEWYDPQIGTAIVSVAYYGLTFSRSAVLKMGNPEYVMLGYDKDSKIVGIKVCDEQQKMKIPFSSKERSGNVRINNKDFIRFILTSFEDNTVFDKKAIRYTGVWNEEQKIMTIDLNKPISGEDAEESEE